MLKLIGALIELGVPASIIVLFIQQTVWQIYKDRPVFPMLREKSSTERLLEKAEREETQAAIELEAARKLARAEELQRQSEQIMFGKDPR